MTNGNYTKLAKVLGKLAKMYDDATAAIASNTTLSARLVEQVADQEVFELDRIIAEYVSQLNSTISSGPSAMQTLAGTMLTRYLQSAEVLAYFAVPLAAGTSAKAVAEALITEMTNDGKTFTTLSGTGIVNFIESVLAPDGDFPQSGVPTYADASYVVATIVA